MTGTAFYVVAAIALCAALVKAPAAFRRYPAPGQRPIFVLLLAVAASCFLLSDKVQVREDLLSHDLGRLLSDVTTMIAAFAILALLITITYPPEQACPKLLKRLAALGAAAAGLAKPESTASQSSPSSGCCHRGSPCSRNSLRGMNGCTVLARWVRHLRRRVVALVVNERVRPRIGLCNGEFTLRETARVLSASQYCCMGWV